MREIEWTETALADMAALDNGIARRVKQSVERFAATGAGNTKRLQGIDPPQFRLRVGDYRVRFHLAPATDANPPCPPSLPSLSLTLPSASQTGRPTINNRTGDRKSSGPGTPPAGRGSAVDRRELRKEVCLPPAGWNAYRSRAVLPMT